MRIHKLQISMMKCVSKYEDTLARIVIRGAQNITGNCSCSSLSTIRITQNLSLKQCYLHNQNEVCCVALQEAYVVNSPSHTTSSRAIICRPETSQHGRLPIMTSLPGPRPPPSASAAGLYSLPVSNYGSRQEQK